MKAFSMAGLYILCVDDDPDTCASMSDILTDLGYLVSVAYDGHAALQLVQQQYGLALLDYRMPGMDGLELGASGNFGPAWSLCLSPPSPAATCWTRRGRSGCEKSSPSRWISRNYCRWSRK
jgi:DNA-binding LytR/AlgR family response regulator